jgi:hypothetical protein
VPLAPVPEVDLDHRPRDVLRSPPDRSHTAP